VGKTQAVLSFFVQIRLDSLPINICGEYWPLNRSREKCVPFSDDPPERRCGYGDSDEMQTINNSEDDKDAQTKTDNPKPASHGGRTSKPITIFESLPTGQYLLCLVVHDV